MSLRVLEKSWKGFEMLSMKSVLCLTRRKAQQSDSNAVLEAFKFIESAAAELSDEDDDEDSDGKDRTIMDSGTVSGGTSRKFLKERSYVLCCGFSLCHMHSVSLSLSVSHAFLSPPTCPETDSSPLPPYRL